MMIDLSIFKFSSLMKDIIGQADRLKEKEDFELHFKEAEDKSSAEKMELQGDINQLKQEMPRMIVNALKKMGFNSMQKPTTQVYLYIFQYNQHQYFLLFGSLNLD